MIEQRPKCPTNSEHQNTRVYYQDVHVRKCSCNDCGASWRLAAVPVLTEDIEYLTTLAESLRSSPIQTIDKTAVIAISVADMKSIADRLTDIASRGLPEKRKRPATSAPAQPPARFSVMNEPSIPFWQG